MRFYFSHLLPHVRFEIIEGVKVSRIAGDGAHLACQVRPEFVFLHPKQTAIGVVDNDELLRVEQVMRNNQGAQRIVGGYAASIADHVRVPWLQSQAAFKQNSGIHASQDSQAPARPDGQISEVEVPYKFFVSFQQFVCD
jgi:hypothetical protein